MSWPDDKYARKVRRDAAQYVRMSTEHQRNSTENQADAIACYAEERDYKVIKTYSDAGKSGLRIEGRDGLTQLLDDIQVGKAEFNTVLVYDISRWGRFQDADESAYYEYICKRAGIAVEYCAEQFDNDGSPVSTIVKGVKRAEDVNVQTVLRKAYERKLLRGGRLLAAKRLVEARLKHGKGQATSIGRSKKNLSLETQMKTYQDDVACADSWRPRRASCQRSQRQHQDITRKAASPGWHLR